MNEPIPIPRVLAELLRLQRWAGGDPVPADRIFGLLHGFETVIRQESKSFGISEKTQRKVEDMLQDVDSGAQATDGMALKHRMYDDGVDETDAADVLELCRLQGRWTDAIDAVVNGQGSTFSGLSVRRQPEQDWFGSLHYIELVDCTDGVRNPMHAVFAPAIPRVGEIITPQRGSTMEVVGVEHLVADQGKDEGIRQHILIPHVLLQMLDDPDGEAG